MEEKQNDKKMWRNLQATPEEQELINQIIESGAGRSLPEEQLNLYRVAKEWDMEIPTRVGKTISSLFLYKFIPGIGE